MKKHPGAATPHARPRALSNDRARAVPIKRRKGMSFSDHKITSFTHKIADLPDQPNLPADELKARFDSSPEELRESVNGICDDADRLDERVSGIIAETFGDTIDKEMLSDELAAELDAKATQTALAAEAAAREDADDALQTAVSQKCEVYVGSYIGDGAAQRTISLGFTPKAVLTMYVNGCTANPAQAYYYGGLALAGYPVSLGSTNIVSVVENGFQVYHISGYNGDSNTINWKYYYLAFR